MKIAYAMRIAEQRRMSADRHLFFSGVAVIIKTDYDILSDVTWLILPVVICLSMRLSHACLSINFYTVKLRMAQYTSCNLLD